MRLPFIVFAFALLLGFISPSVSAALTPIIFTSTADFDSGTKEPQATPTDYFDSTGLSQPTYGVINNPESLYEASTQRTYVVWQSGSPDPHSDHDPYISYYDHITGKWLDTPIKIAHWILTNDDHGAPAIVEDSNGIFHVFGGTHGTIPPQENGNLFYTRSLYPSNVNVWVSQPSPVTGHVTYQKPIIANNIIYIFYRNGTSNTGNLSYVQSSNFGNSWSSPKDIVNFATPGFSLYQGNIVLYGTRIFMSWVKATTNGTVRIDAYNAFFDTSNGHMFCEPRFPTLVPVDLGLVIDATEADTYCKVFVSFALKQDNIPATRVGPGGNPYLILPSNNDGTWKFYLVYWDSVEVNWIGPTAIATTDDQFNFADFAIHSATDFRAYLITSGVAGRGGDLQEWRWDGTGSWHLSAYIYNESTSGRPLNLPSIPYPSYHANAEVYFAQSQVDEYRWSTQKLYVWGESGLLRGKTLDYSTETSTDSGHIATGNFELRSQYGDSFVQPKQDADTFLWKPATKQTGGSTGIQNETNIQRINQGTLQLNASKGFGSASLLWGGVTSKFTFSGDFDLRWFVNPTIISEGNVRLQILNENGLVFSDSGTASGVLYQLSGAVGFPQGIRAFTVTNGIASSCGTSSDISSFPFWMRISRATNTWTFYYSSDGSSWTTDESCANTVIGNLYVGIQVITGATLHCVLDNFLLTSGTITGNAFVTTGSWSTPLQMDNTNVPSTVTVIYSGATAGRYVDKVSFISKSQGLIYVDSTTHPGGTTFTVTVPQDQVPFGLDDWFVNIHLHGDGSGSVIIAEVDINLQRSSLGIALFDAPLLLGFVALLTLGLVGAFAIKRKRGH